MKRNFLFLFFGFGLLILPLPKNASAQGEAEKAQVRVKNVTFPVRGRWIAGEEQGDFDATNAFEVPAGEVRLMIVPNHPAALNSGFAGHFSQPYRLVGVRARSSMRLSNDSFRLNAGDKLTIHLVQPVPPWNAVMLRVRKEWVLVTIERPDPQHDLDKFKSGKWDRKEEFPNAMLFWARDGDKAMAKELAKAFVANRENLSATGCVRGLRHTSIMVLSGTNGPLAKISEEELTTELTEAFELLRRQTLPSGQSIERLITVAKGFLD